MVVRSYIVSECVCVYAVVRYVLWWQMAKFNFSFDFSIDGLFRLCAVLLLFAVVVIHVVGIYFSRLPNFSYFGLA